MRVLLLLIFTCTISCALSQKMDNAISFRQVASDTYFRINYENDLFVGTDKNYTQGYSFEFVSPVLMNNPINKILLQLPSDYRRAGLVFEHVGFTPDRYEKPEVQFGDRPFASVAMLRSFMVSTDEQSHQRVSSHFSFGIMGPATLGKEIQTALHKITDSRTPQGWHNQIENHLVINYGIDYEKELLRFQDYIGINASASAKLGNVYTNAGLGMNMTFGLIDNSFQGSSSRKYSLYGYIQPLLTMVGYDGTLQGGIIKDDSAYTIPSSDINRAVGQITYGLVLQTKYIYFEYHRVNITQEVKTLSAASWGGISVGIKM